MLFWSWRQLHYCRCRCCLTRTVFHEFPVASAEVCSTPSPVLFGRLKGIHAKGRSISGLLPFSGERHSGLQAGTCEQQIKFFLIWHTWGWKYSKILLVLKYLKPYWIFQWFFFYLFVKKHVFAEGTHFHVTDLCPCSALPQFPILPSAEKLDWAVLPLPSHKILWLQLGLTWCDIYIGYRCEPKIGYWIIKDFI